MKNKTHIILKVMLFCLAFCLCVISCSCQTQNTPKEEDTEAISCQIFVSSEGGMPFYNVYVAVYEDASKQELICVGKTDKQGMISFEKGAKKGYVAVLEGIPNGYTVAETYPVETKEVTITLSTYLEPNADIQNYVFETGDIMIDFTMSDLDGNQYTLSEVLKEKKAVILNFWYTQCQPCKAEFPYMQEAYEEYADEILLLACNTVDTDVQTIAAFVNNLELTFPAVQCNAAWERAIGLTGYPTTVIIDRYGMVSFIHTGTMPDTERFRSMFAFYTDDDYRQQVVETVEVFANGE